MDRLKNKCALLMGATSGIGQSCAEMVAREGAHIVVTGRRPAQAEAVPRTFVKAGGEATFKSWDVTQPEPAEDAVRYVIAGRAGLDTLLNKAGGSGTADGPVTPAAIDEF